jgi:Rrf2 family protein
MMIGEIAAQERISRKFLEQILLELKHHGIVVSKRGKFGGYALLMPAAQITFGQLLRIVDGPIAPLPCLSRIAYRRCVDCHSKEECEIRRVFARVATSARTCRIAPASPTPSPHRSGSRQGPPKAISGRFPRCRQERQPNRD